ncbi:MAG: type secretion system protein [Actinomycetia bacterium]|nr:type secretion system protein [Actinomycetes bacterium]
MVTSLRAWVSALLCSALILTGPVASALAPGATGHISAAQVAPGRLQFLLSVDGLPAGSELDPGSVRAKAGGRALRATAEPPSGTRSAQTGGRPAARTVMIVLDTSGSMGTTDMRAAQKGALAYLVQLPKDVSAGLATTGTGGANRLALAPTTNRDALTTAIHAIHSGGQTALYDAMSIALAQLNRAQAESRRLIVLSDGKDSASKASLTAVTGELARQHVPADVVAFKTQATSEVTLKRLADASGGRLLHSPDAKRMVQAFANAAKTFSQAMWVTAEIPASLAGRTSRLEILVMAGATTVRTTTSVTFAGTRASTVATTPVPTTNQAPVGDTGSQPSLGLLIVLAVCFMAILIGVLATAGLLRRGDRPEWTRHIEHYGVRPEEGTGGTQQGALAQAALMLSQRVVESGSFEERMTRDLDRAGMTIRPHEWVLLRGVIGLALIVLLAAISGNLLVSVPIGAVIAWFVTRAYLNGKQARRLGAFSDQLPDALQLVAGSLRSGFTVAQALDRVAQQDIRPLASEMSRALAETRLGNSVEDALDKVAGRMDCRDLSWVVMAIRIQREVGGNLADVIETTVETMRERTRLRRHVRALSAEGRLSAYILIGLPFGCGGFMFLIRPEYTRVLFTDPLGLVMLFGGAVLMTVGWFWISRIVKVET